MSNVELVYLVAVFVGVFAIALSVVYFLAPSPTRKRLETVVGDAPEGDAPPETAWVEKLAKVSAPLGKLSLPEEGAESSAVRRRFMNAGFRDPSAPAVFYGGKSILALALPALAFAYVTLMGVNLQPSMLLFVFLAMAALGYYMPNVILTRLIASRQREILESFPDAIDLMTVCVEAGLTINATLVRVADEMRLQSRVLSEELNLVNLELRAGSSRDKALRNLALRTGVEDVETLTSMLIQAEKFGTSIADSLRVYSDTLRTKRRLRAEEAAAKIALKLLFPLIFCMFPALLLVVLGPAFIQIYRVLLPTMSGQ